MRVRNGLVLVALLGLITALVVPAASARPAGVIVLPGASSAEGITSGHGATFYAGDLFQGDIFRGDLQRGTAELFIDAPVGRMALGMAFDAAHDLLFVAGGPTGQGYVYDTRTGSTVATYQFASPPAGFINDITVTRDGAWFTDSLQAQLYFVPISPADSSLGQFSTLALSGPAADTSGDFNLNGIEATPNGKTLIVAHSAKRCALHGRSSQWREGAHRWRERAECRWHRAKGEAAVGSAKLQQPGDETPAKPRPSAPAWSSRSSRAIYSRCPRQRPCLVADWR